MSREMPQRARSGRAVHFPPIDQQPRPAKASSYTSVQRESRRLRATDGGPGGVARAMAGGQWSYEYAVVEHQGKAAARIGSSVLGDVADRMSYLKAQIPDAGDITIEKVLQVTTAKLQGLTAGVRLLVVRSQEIDSLGEKHELLARQLMDTAFGRKRGGQALSK